jgi:peptidylprolyl isomerase
MERLTLALFAWFMLAMSIAQAVPARPLYLPGASAKMSDIITKESGLKWIESNVGAGKEAKAGDTVEVHYTGTLTDGKKFDSSRDRGQPFSFKLGVGQVIKGWDEGVAGMKEGGKRKLMIPANLAYGDRAVGGGLIPANSELHFDVELVKVK